MPPTCACMYVYTHTHVCIHTLTDMYLYVICVYVYIYLYMYIYIYIYNDKPLTYCWCSGFKLTKRNSLVGVSSTILPVHSRFRKKWEKLSMQIRPAESANVWNRSNRAWKLCLKFQRQACEKFKELGCFFERNRKSLKQIVGHRYEGKDIKYLN